LRLLFERLGAKIDSLIGGEGGDTEEGSSVRSALSGLSPTLQRAIDNNLREDEKGVVCLAPHHLRVLLDYDSYCKFSQPGLRAMQEELTTLARQYINDRRYKLSQPINLVLTYDPVGTTTKVRADFGETAPSQLPDETGTKHPSGIYRFLSVSGPLAFSVDLKDFKKGGSPVTIGRGSDNIVVLDDQSISKFHATLAFDSEGNLILADCGSTNGTSINGQTVEGRGRVAVGDLLGFGDIRLRLERVE